VDGPNLELARGFSGCRAGVKNNHLARLNQVGRGSPDLDFLRSMHRLLEIERVVVGRFQLPDCAAMRPNQSPGGAQGIQIGADGNCRNRKPIHQVSNGNLPLTPQQVQDGPAALLREQRIGAFGLSHPCDFKDGQMLRQLLSTQNCFLLRLLWGINSVRVIIEIPRCRPGTFVVAAMGPIAGQSCLEWPCRNGETVELMEMLLIPALSLLPAFAVSFFSLLFIFCVLSSVFPCNRRGF
jgi:hypothetical protein